MASIKEIVVQWKVILLLIFLLFALVAIHPRFNVEGVAIRSVQPNSTASIVGVENPSAKLTPLQRERILSLNGEPVSSVEEYYALTSQVPVNQTVRLQTTKSTYSLIVPAHRDLGLKIYPAPHSNLRKGLDLEGGTRVLLEPETAITPDELELTIASLTERLNVYGLSDVVVRSAADLTGKEFILIEIAGVTEDEVRDLLARQGKFEAKIGNETVFFGGKKDITYVCRSADCSGIDPRRGCSRFADGYGCNFFFTITLSPEAAQRQARLTDGLTVIKEGDSGYLSADIGMFLDDKEVDHLKIGAELKGRASTNIQISGSGTGRTQADAAAATLQNMKRLQTIIITGSLPTKLNVVKLDTISPSLGKEFLNNVMLVGLLAVLAVVGVVSARYRQWKVILPMIFTLLSEIVLVLGFAAFVGWNLDLAAIAGIIIMVGTGVDHLIIITDETVRGEAISDWKKKMKNAMGIVFGAFLTTATGMIPLWFAGAGLLKGFAFTTLVGLCFGVLIARSAYAAMIEKIME